MKGGLLYLAAVVAASMFSVSLAAAPVPATPPPGAPTPGQVQSTLPTQTAQPKQTPPPSAGTPATNAQGIAPGGPSFHVNSFSIEGNSVIPTDELQAQIAGYLGQDLTLSQLYDVADVLTRYYRAKGYGLAYVTPPAQKLSAGNVRLQVVEGHVGNIDIQGNKRTHTPVLLKRTRGLNSGDTYTNAAAERAVLLMNDLPGVQAREVLSPGQAPGSSDILFDVNERGYGGDISVDDYGRASIGRWRLNVDADVNSLTGNGDQLSAGITHAEDHLLNFGKLGYLFPMGSSSTLTTSFNRAFYHVGGDQFAALQIEGSTQNAGLNWQYASIRSQDKSLYWGVGLTHDTSKTYSNPTGSTQVYSITTNITLLQLTMLYTRQFADQSYYNINGNFWTNGASNAGGNTNYAERFHFQLDGSYVKPFAETWEFIGQGSVAYSQDPLVDGDKYSLGGPSSVRGFQSADARGDRGLFASGEVQRTFVPSVKFPLAWGLFLDAGRVWTKGVEGVGIGGKGKTITTIVIPNAAATLESIGTELQLLPSSTGWTARLQFAWAVGRNRPSDDLSVTDIKNGIAPHDRGPHIWFTLGKSF